MALTEYTFQSTWHVRAPLALTYAAIEDVHNWKQWWPGLRQVTATRPLKGIGGAQAILTWQAALGYELRIRITVTSSVKKSDIAFTSDGDLMGEGSWLFKESTRSTTVMTINWHVRTTKRWMNVCAPLLRPVFILSHHKLMHQGEQGLNKYLRAISPGDGVYS
jgi:hypothetical protein